MRQERPEDGQSMPVPLTPLLHGCVLTRQAMAGPHRYVHVPCRCFQGEKLLAHERASANALRAKLFEQMDALPRGSLVVWTGLQLGTAGKFSCNTEQNSLALACVVGHKLRTSIPHSFHLPVSDALAPSKPMSKMLGVHC